MRVLWTRVGFAMACAAVVLLLAPGISAACAVCMTGLDDETRVAFELMAAFMTVIPFVLVGGVFYWLRGRLKQIEANHEQVRAAAVEAFSHDSQQAPGFIPAKVASDR